ncbi:MAG: DUF4105 domain-containing protein [Halobacteriovoraceae bacterium]|nr:DUF4105 domain-containing protein [Halobacteriovoraceae bacterium]
MAQTTKEIESFAKSKQWQNILYIQQNGKSLVKGDHFFISNIGFKDSKSELKATINSFKSSIKHKNGMFLECVFMGRKHVILKKWPGLYKPKKCVEYEQWVKGLDAGDLYLVFASAYPSNPASMFGHTFFRFNRKSRGNERVTKELLGYSFAFQARTSPDDNAFEYTLKGLTGGYFAFLDIKPHYMNVGIYNNSESRDIWEYKISLTTNEKDLFIKHAWEISHTVAFDYYFLDENCSTFLLRQLEVIRPSFKSLSKDHLFVVPQETLKEVVRSFNSKISQYKPSIKKQIESQFTQLTSKQKTRFSRAKYDENELELISEPLVLSALVDYWKWKNYDVNTRLSPLEKKIMFRTMERRSQFKTIDILNNKVLDDEEIYRPSVGHGFNKVVLASGVDFQKVSLRYGFHDFFDSPIGHDDSSYIKFLDLQIRREKINGKERLEKAIDIVDILSIQNYYWNLPAVSWRVNASYKDYVSNKKLSLLGGLGIGRKSYEKTFYSLVTFSGQKTNDSFIGVPGLNIGVKQHLYGEKTFQIFIVGEYLGEKFTRLNKMIEKYKLALIYYQQEHRYSFFTQGVDAGTAVGLEYSYTF